MKTINFGIIGCGDVTEIKSGPAFQKLEGSNLIAVMRRDEKKLVDYATRHNVPYYSTDYMDLLKNDKIDAIYIATPPHMHHFYTLEAARHGKAVYVEKPMATTVEECREMIQACEVHQVPLFVAYYRRAQDKFRKAKELLDRKELGEIRSFQYIYTSKPPVVDPERTWLMKKEAAGGGLLYDIGSHMIDMILYLFGEVTMATGISGNQSKEFQVNDITSGIIQFHNQVSGTVQFTFNGYEKRDELIITGSEGTMCMSIMSNDSLKVLKKDQSYELSFPTLEHVEMPYIKWVVDTLMGKDHYDTSGIYGLRTQEILETFENSSVYQGRSYNKEVNLQ